MTCINTLVMRAGRRNVHVKSTGYRQHMSIMHICNAAGISLPPLYIFQGKKTKKNLLYGAPTGTDALQFHGARHRGITMFDPMLASHRFTFRHARERLLHR
jgi:hypothetical protein